MHVSIHGWRVARMVYIYCCFACQRDPSLGRSERRILHPYILYPSSGASGIWPSGFLFYKVYYKQLGLSTKNWGLRSVLEGYPFDFWCPIFFRRRFRSCWWIFSHCPFLEICWVFPSTRSSWQYLLLLPGCLYPPAHMLAVSLGSLSSPQGSLFFRCSNYSRRDCSASASDVPGSLIPAFLFSCSVKKKVSWYLLPAIQQAYFGDRLSSSFCRGGDN